MNTITIQAEPASLDIDLAHAALLISDLRHLVAKRVEQRRTLAGIRARDRNAEWCRAGHLGFLDGWNAQLRAQDPCQTDNLQ
jgi:hypothetical protein